MHPYIIGEISLGSLVDRRETLMTLLRTARPSTLADIGDVAAMIEDERLFGLGMSATSTFIFLLPSPGRAGAKLWTRDRRLNAVAERLGIAARLSALSFRHSAGRGRQTACWRRGTARVAMAATAAQPAKT